jgi:hypothetical protein
LPGYGVKRINMLDIKVGTFVSMHKEPIRDLAFNPVFQVRKLALWVVTKCRSLTKGDRGLIFPGQNSLCGS